MTDSPDSTASAESDAKEKDSSKPSDIDTDDLKAAVEQAGAEAVLAADIAALKRATGHVPSLQKRIDAVEKAAARLDSLESSNRALAERFDALLLALPENLIPAATAARLRPEVGDSNAAVLAKIADLEAKLAAKPEEVDPDPRVAAWRAQWDAATTSVQTYAARVKVDPTSIPDAEWQRAMTAHSGDPAGAALAMMKFLDAKAADGDADSRRAEKKDAGSGGVQGSRSARGDGKGALPTFEQLKKMTRDEILLIPSEDRMKILATAGQ